MKRYLALFSLIAAIFSGCELLPDPEPESSMSAEIDGDTWIPGTANGAHAPVISVRDGEPIDLVGWLFLDNGDAEIVQIWFPNDFKGKGTYDGISALYQDIDKYSTPDMDVHQYTTDSWTDGESANTITFTKYDMSEKRASGTFAFIMYDKAGNKIRVKDGKFSNVFIHVLD